MNNLASRIWSGASERAPCDEKFITLCERQNFRIDNLKIRGGRQACQG